MKRTVLIVLGVIFLSGCQFFSKNKSSPAVMVSHDGLTAKIVDRGRLKTGGNLLLIPFTAGPGVSASADLDRTSLVLVKEIFTSLEKDGSALVPLTDADASRAELIFQGHIIQKSRAGKIKSWIGGPRRTMAVEGKLIDNASGRVVLELSHRRVARKRAETYNDLAAAIGQDIGAFFAAGGGSAL